MDQYQYQYIVNDEEQCVDDKDNKEEQCVDDKDDKEEQYVDDNEVDDNEVDDKDVDDKEVDDKEVDNNEVDDEDDNEEDDNEEYDNEHTEKKEELLFIDNNKLLFQIENSTKDIVNKIKSLEHFDVQNIKHYFISILNNLESYNKFNDNWRDDIYDRDIEIYNDRINKYNEDYVKYKMYNYNSFEE